jgi:DNA-binding Xre family transcriptional regulator
MKERDGKMMLRISEAIRILLVRRGNRSESSLAKELGMTPQNFNRKLKREHFVIEDIEAVCKALDVTLKVSFVFNDTGEEFAFRS